MQEALWALYHRPRVMTVETDSLEPNTTKSEGITNDKDTTVQDEDAVAR